MKKALLGFFVLLLWGCQSSEISDKVFEDVAYLETLSLFVRSEVALEKENYFDDYDAARDQQLLNGTAPTQANFKQYRRVDGPEGRGLLFHFPAGQLGSQIFEILVPVGLLNEFVSPEHREWFTTIPGQQRVDYIGLPPEQARQMAKDNGTSFRVVEKDGQPLPTTKDWRPGRINATVGTGVVVSYEVEGE